MDRAQPAQHGPAGRRPRVPLAGPRTRGRRLGARAADAVGRHRLARRVPRPQARPDLAAGPDPRPRRRPALHPGRRHRPGDARDHPVVGRGDPAAARPAAVGPGAAAAHPRLQRAAGALPRQGGDVQPALRLPAAAARRRRGGRRDAGQGVRLGLRVVGDRAVLVGRRAVRLPGLQAAADHRALATTRGRGTSHRRARRSGPADGPAMPRTATRLRTPSASVDAAGHPARRPARPGADAAARPHRAPVARRGLPGRRRPQEAQPSGPAAGSPAEPVPAPAAAAAIRAVRVRSPPW